MLEWLKRKKKDVTIFEINEKTIIHEDNIYIRHDEHQERELLKIISIETGIIEMLLKDEHKHHNKPIFTLSTIINKQQFIMADISLTLGGTAPTGVFTLLDNKTATPLTGVTFSNQQVGANSNPEFATFALDGSNNVVPTAVSAGSGTVTFTTHADYTDPGDNSAQSADFTVTKNFTVVAGADGVSLDVVFS